MLTWYTLGLWSGPRSPWRLPLSREAFHALCTRAGALNQCAPCWQALATAWHQGEDDAYWADIPGLSGRLSN